MQNSVPEIPGLSHSQEQSVAPDVSLRCVTKQNVIQPSTPRGLHCLQYSFLQQAVTTKSLHLQAKILYNTQKGSHI